MEGKTWMSHKVLINELEHKCLQFSVVTLQGIVVLIRSIQVSINPAQLKAFVLLRHNMGYGGKDIAG